MFMRAKGGSPRGSKLVVKFGLTNDLLRRFGGHERHFGVLPGADFRVVKFIMADEDELDVAEAIFAAWFEPLTRDNKSVLHTIGDDPKVVVPGAHDAAGFFKLGVDGVLTAFTSAEAPLWTSATSRRDTSKAYHLYVENDRRVRIRDVDDPIVWAFPAPRDTVNFLQWASGIESKEDVAHLMGDSVKLLENSVLALRHMLTSYNDAQWSIMEPLTRVIDNLLNIITDQEELDATAALDCYVAKADCAIKRRIAEGTLDAAAVDLANALAGADRNDKEEVEEKVLAQWVAGWRSLRLEAMRLARKVEKKRLSDEDIAAPAVVWSAVLAEMAPRIGKDAAHAMGQVAAAASRAAAGTVPMELVGRSGHACQ
ncbi:hypothetical protein HDU88_002647 [Geranomyces variabilis]|nr:hypothetical protein HDU88_002647 [Geranomyces variabilis]